VGDRASLAFLCEFPETSKLIGKIVGICMSQVLLTNRYVSFRETVPNYYRGGAKNHNFWIHFYQKSRL